MLQHVEHMDKLHNIPPPEGAAKHAHTSNAIVPMPATPNLRYCGDDPEPVPPLTGWDGTRHYSHFSNGTCHLLLAATCDQNSYFGEVTSQVAVSPQMYAD